LLSESFNQAAEEIDLWIIIVACLFSVLLFVLVGIVLWKVCDLSKILQQ
jgi:hypothetical protein